MFRLFIKSEEDLRGNVPYSVHNAPTEKLGINNLLIFTDLWQA
jgi:hypothetical protein